MPVSNLRSALAVKDCVMQRIHLLAYPGVLLLALVVSLLLRASAISGDGRPSASRTAGIGNRSEVCVSSASGPLTVLATSTPVPFITGSTAPRLQLVDVAPAFALSPSQPFGRPSTDANHGASRSLKDWAAGLFENSGQKAEDGGRNKDRKPNTPRKGPEWCWQNSDHPQNSARGGLSRLQWMSADTAIRNRAPGQFIS